MWMCGGGSVDGGGGLLRGSELDLTVENHSLRACVVWIFYVCYLHVTIPSPSKCFSLSTFTPCPSHHALTIQPHGESGHV